MKIRTLVPGLVALLAPLVLSGCDCGKCGEVADMVGAGAKLVSDAQSAPGTAEMKDEGCETAMAFTPKMLAKFVASIPQDTKKDEKAPPPPTLPYPIAICQVKGKAPSCKKVAKAYGKGSGHKKFGINVQVSGEQEPKCAGVYNRKGKRLKDLDKKALKNIKNVAK